MGLLAINFVCKVFFHHFCNIEQQVSECFLLESGLVSPSVVCVGLAAPTVNLMSLLFLWLHLRFSFWLWLQQFYYTVLKRWFQIYSAMACRVSWFWSSGLSLNFVKFLAYNSSNISYSSHTPLFLSLSPFFLRFQLYMFRPLSMLRFFSSYIYLCDSIYIFSTAYFISLFQFTISSVATNSWCAHLLELFQF